MLGTQGIHTCTATLNLGEKMASSFPYGACTMYSTCMCLSTQINSPKHLEILDTPLTPSMHAYYDTSSSHVQWFSCLDIYM